MAQTSYALMTNAGRAREAAAMAGGTQLVITHMAIGDSQTVPSGGETQLYNEVLRKPISGQGTVAGQSDTAYFEMFLSASEGPFTIREAGIFDSTGTLIAIAHFDPPINKAAPSSGAVSEGNLRMQVAFSNVANVNILVSSDSQVIPSQRLLNMPDIPVMSVSLTAPPANPAIGDIYVVAANPTGQWAGQAQKVAEYVAGGWSFIAARNGHIVSIPSGATYIKISGVYVPFTASTTMAGLLQLASPAEAAAGTDDAKAVTSKTMAARIARAVMGDVYLTYAAPNLVLLPERSGSMLIEDTARIVPAGGVSIGSSGNTALTLYYIYAAWSGAAVVLEKSATAPTLDATTRQMVKTGDRTRAYIGVAYSNTDGTWLGGSFVASHYNKKPRIQSAQNPTGSSYSGTTYNQLTPSVQFVTDDGFMQALGQGSVNIGTQVANNSNPGRIAIGTDTQTGNSGQASRVHSAVTSGSAFYHATSALARGYHYTAIVGSAPAANNPLYFDNLEIVVLTNG